jgi:hypothetical protein
MSAQWGVETFGLVRSFFIIFVYVPKRYGKEKHVIR